MNLDMANAVIAAALTLRRGAEVVTTRDDDGQVRVTFSIPGHTAIPAWGINIEQATVNLGCALAEHYR